MRSPRATRPRPKFGRRRSGHYGCATPLLHDGRASSIDEAIQMHGENATPAREAYEVLTENRRWALLEMLAGL